MNVEMPEEQKIFGDYYQEEDIQPNLFTIGQLNNSNENIAIN